MVLVIGTIAALSLVLGTCVPLTVHAPNEVYYGDVERWILIANEVYPVNFCLDNIVYGEYDGVEVKVPDELEAFVIPDETIHVFLTGNIVGYEEYGGYGLSYETYGLGAFVLINSETISDELLAHELGHAMGLGHRTLIKNIMNHYVYGGRELTNKQFSQIGDFISFWLPELLDRDRVVILNE